MTESWLAAVETKLDGLLSHVKWDKAKLRSRGLAQHLDVVTMHRENDHDAQQKIAQHQAINYDPRFVPIAVAARFERPLERANSSDQRTPLRVLLDTAKLVEPYTKYKPSIHRPSLVLDSAEVPLTSDPRAQLRVLPSWSGIPAKFASLRPTLLPANKLHAWLSGRLAGITTQPAEIVYIVSFLTTAAPAPPSPDACAEHFELFLDPDTARAVVVDLWKYLASVHLESQISLQFEEGELEEADEATDLQPLPVVPTASSGDVLPTPSYPFVTVKKTASPAPPNSNTSSSTRIDEYDELSRLAELERAKRPTYRSLPPGNIGLRTSGYDTAQKIQTQRERAGGKELALRERRRRVSYRTKTRNTPTKIARQLIHMRMDALDEYLEKQSEQSGSPREPPRSSSGHGRRNERSSSTARHRADSSARDDDDRGRGRSTGSYRHHDETYSYGGACYRSRSRERDRPCQSPSPEYRRHEKKRNRLPSRDRDRVSGDPPRKRSK